jgi:hypothetical protein
MVFPRFRFLRAPLVSCVLLLALLVALAVSLAALSPDRLVRRIWKKYYTLYIERSDLTQELVLRIAAGDRFQAVVSRYTAAVGFNTFDGFSVVPIHRLASRLDPLDPRFDPYMHRVQRLFEIGRGGPWEVVYLRSDRNVISSYFHLRSVFSGRGIRWRLIEFDPVRAVIRVVLSLLYLFAGAWLCSNTLVRLAVLSACLPWLLLVALSGFPSLLALFVVMPALIHLFERLHARWYDRSFFRHPGLEILRSREVWALAAAVGLAVLLHLPGALGGLVLPVLSVIPAAAFLYRLLIFQHSRRAHPVFRTLPILRRFRPRRASISAAATLHLLMALLALCSYPVLHLAGSFSKSPAEMIRMRAIGGGKAELSWRSLTALSDHSSGGIPDLADYLTHRAYQESLMFGRPYSFPKMEERILISDYRVHPENARVHQTFRVVKQFKESWLGATLAAAVPGSVPRLLADQGYAGAVQIERSTEPAGRYGFSALLAVLFLLHFLVPRHINLTASALYATRNLTLRRH